MSEGIIRAYIETLRQVRHKAVDEMADKRYHKYMGILKALEEGAATTFEIIEYNKWDSYTYSTILRHLKQLQELALVERINAKPSWKLK